MYQYEYEKIKITRTNFKAFHSFIYAPDNFHNIINKKASEGYRYVGYILTVQTSEGLVLK